MELSDFYMPDQYDSDRWQCKRCGALVGDLKQHYAWHRSVDTTATVAVIHNDHTRL